MAVTFIWKTSRVRLDVEFSLYACVTCSRRPRPHDFKYLKESLQPSDSSHKNKNVTCHNM